MLLQWEVNERKDAADSQRPDHHVVALPAASSFAWTTTPSPLLASPKDGPVSFRNPWPSWYKPTPAQVWSNLQWGDRGPDPHVDLATSHLSDIDVPTSPPAENKRPNFTDIASKWPDSTGAKAARLLGVQDPDFTLPETQCNAKVTWLGHAGLLVQLPPRSQNPSDRTINCVFDPIFSTRSSPSKNFGPIRTYPPPCTVEALPPLDAVFISHNHYDHLDTDTITSIWTHHQPTVRFFAGLGNKQWFLDIGIPSDRVLELDWWDSAQLSSPNSPDKVKIWCTPSQHSSGRSGSEPNSTLWASWTLEYHSPDATPYRVFFAGDTGYRFHEDPAWPPPPPAGARWDSLGPVEVVKDEDEDTKYPACPAFEEIRDRIGAPHLLLLPISVGATYSYLKSLVFLPEWMSPVPWHSPGVTAANHMPAWDAVRVMKLMTGGEPAVAVGMHWGTFVPDPMEVLGTLGQLEWACVKQGVKFGRDLESEAAEKGQRFLALNHGQSVCL
ncbi:beta-lactamase superfamily domain-containing protein [Podospora aff. communis PSN243]|uniref:Beta-lactamase superfamily domain-containing protein n=1 Tax=Podospora aff. communis PSN243 TaxID=3040156 RepID=A0AAV9G570_9PEZI|nr:beta-lactamase superfamily domain-containing protein [Podospora aff. communis PSN243]